MANYSPPSFMILVPIIFETFTPSFQRDSESTKTSLTQNNLYNVRIPSKSVWGCALQDFHNTNADWSAESHQKGIGTGTAPRSSNSDSQGVLETP